MLLGESSGRERCQKKGGKKKIILSGIFTVNGVLLEIYWFMLPLTKILRRIIDYFCSSLPKTQKTKGSLDLLAVDIIPIDTNTNK